MGYSKQDWAMRFRKTNAAKHYACDVDAKAAQEVDPTAYLQSRGYRVTRDGRHLSVKTNKREEIYRITHRDGRWVWCDCYGKKGGDNIDLVRQIEGTGYIEAVSRLAEVPVIRQQPCPDDDPKRPPPQLPSSEGSDAAQGRDYLRGRGISRVTIDHAENTGLVRYAAGCVFFCGYDGTGIIRSVTRRAIHLTDRRQKTDLRGSDKSYAPILTGSTDEVWIVEGGMDALALHDLALRNDNKPPTAIVSGGANVRSFLERDRVQDILRQATSVIVAGENEKNKDAQARADDGHAKQARRIEEITGRPAQHFTPDRDDGKDLADMNSRQQADTKTKRAPAAGD